VKYNNWFCHQTSARNDAKLQDVMIVSGLKGVGAYWCLVEMMYEQGGRLLLSDIKRYAYALRIEANELQELINCSAFDKDETHFWTSGVLKQIEHRSGISEKRSIAGKKKHTIQTNNTYIHTKLVDQLHNNCSTIAQEHKTKASFIKPNIEEIKAYCSEKGYSIDAPYFWNYYEARGWMLGKNKIKSWKSCVKTWVLRNQSEQPKTNKQDILKLQEEQQRYFDGVTV